MIKYFDNFKEASQFAKQHTRIGGAMYSVKREDNRWKIWSDIDKAMEEESQRIEKEQELEPIRYRWEIEKDQMNSAPDRLWSEDESASEAWSRGRDPANESYWDDEN